MPRLAPPRAIPALATAFALTLAAPPAFAQATDGARVGWLDLISPDLVLARAVQFGIVALRTQVDLDYDALAVDVATGKVALTGLRMRPQFAWDEDWACLISADRGVIDLGSPFEIDRLGVSVDLIGGSADLACFPREAAVAFGPLGLESVQLDRARVTVDYRLSSASADVTVATTSPGLAAIDLRGRLDYAALEAKDGNDPVPVVFFKNALLTVEDLGAFEVLRALLPAELKSGAVAGPALAAEIRRQLESGNFTALREAARATGAAEPDRAEAVLTEEQVAFLASFEVQAARVIDGAGQVTLTLGSPREARYVDFDLVADDPREAFSVLSPLLVALPPARSEIVPVALLKKAFDTPAALTDAERLRVGTALVTGSGAPKSIARGLALLAPLAATGDSETALILARALAKDQPVEAYRHALTAAAAGEGGALLLLDTLEAGVSPQAMFDAQRAAAPSAGAPALGAEGVADLRAAALARLTGGGATRSYALAWYWASLGAAAGDAGAAGLRDEVEARVAARGPDAVRNWAAITATLEARMLDAWTDADLPARFGPDQ